MHPLGAPLRAEENPKALDPDIVSEGLGAFDEIEPLGSGTLGARFRVVRDDDTHAVKVIHLEGMPSYLWEREIAALNAVDHPNVVGFRRASTFELGGRRYPFLECDPRPRKEAATRNRNA